MLILLTATAIAVTVTGPLADKAGKLLGLGGTDITVWDIAKWPVPVLVVAMMFAILYYASPNVRQPGLRCRRATNRASCSKRRRNCLVSDRERHAEIVTI